MYGSTEKSRKENRVYVPEGTQVLQDSGAFSDGPVHRLTAQQAIDRQIAHAKKYGYWDKVIYVASYDLLIDERWQGGQRFKERWNEQDADFAINETIANAVFLSNNRQQVNGKALVLTAQGVSSDQYLQCAKSIIPLIQEQDMFGFGGFCITGKMRRKMMPVFADTVKKVMPEIAGAGIKKVHLWGVMLDEALAQIGYWCTKFNIELSTDSVGPSVKPALGSWGYSDWRNKTYRQPPTAIRGIERAKHVQAVTSWLDTFDINKYLHPLYSSYL